MLATRIVCIVAHTGEWGNNHHCLGRISLLDNPYGKLFHFSL